MTQPKATNTDLAPLSERLAQIFRTLFLMESTERLVRIAATRSPSYKNTNQEQPLA
jgi:hypothetical protein